MELHDHINSIVIDLDAGTISVQGFREVLNDNGGVEFHRGLTVRDGLPSFDADRALMVAAQEFVASEIAPRLEPLGFGTKDSATIGNGVGSFDLRVAAAVPAEKPLDAKTGASVGSGG